MPPKPERKLDLPLSTLWTPLPTLRGLGSGTELNTAPPPPLCGCDTVLTRPDSLGARKELLTAELALSLLSNGW